MTSFFRKIKINARYYNSGGEVRAALEDDYHHFRVRLLFNNNKITTIDGVSPRIPFSSCPQAGSELQKLIDLDIPTTSNDIIKMTDASIQCTHLLDLSGLALAMVAKRLKSRIYQIKVPRHDCQKTQAHLTRDSEYHLSWSIENNTLISKPAPYTGISIGKGFAKWALDNLSDEEAEAALVLRRCAIISLGRLKNLDAIKHAKSTGVCYAQQPIRAAESTRVIGSTLDFSHRPELLCQDDLAWLNFAALT
jgi:hypothetical protein